MLFMASPLSLKKMNSCFSPPQRLGSISLHRQIRYVVRARAPPPNTPRRAARDRVYILRPALTDTFLPNHRVGSLSREAPSRCEVTSFNPADDIDFVSPRFVARVCVFVSNRSVLFASYSNPSAVEAGLYVAIITSSDDFFAGGVSSVKRCFYRSFFPSRLFISW